MKQENIDFPRSAIGFLSINIWKKRVQYYDQVQQLSNLYNIVESLDQYQLQGIDYWKKSRYILKSSHIKDQEQINSLLSFKLEYLDLQIKIFHKKLMAKRLEILEMEKATKEEVKNEQKEEIIKDK